MTPTTLSATLAPLLAGSGSGSELDPNSVSPGLVGFLATFGVVLAAILLLLNMTARLRRMKHREELDAEREQAAQDAGREDTAEHSSLESPPRQETGMAGDGGTSPETGDQPPEGLGRR